MSKSETPCWCEEHKPGCAPKAEAPPKCHKNCYTTAGRYAPRYTVHVAVCPNYDPREEEDFVDVQDPKAEAPPAPKSTCPVCGAPFKGYHYCNIKPAPTCPNAETMEPHQCPGIFGCDECAGLSEPTPPPVEQASEPPIDWAEADNWANDPMPQSTERGDVDWLPDAKANAARAYLALKAQNAALTERVQAAERDSSASMELYRSAVARRDDAEAKIATLTAELERLRDLIVLVNCREEYYRGERACFLRCDELVPLHSEARAIRAAREAGKQ